jgi:diadenosine tetraphosphate (Ap4A) HIT family hydrolase
MNTSMPKGFFTPTYYNSILFESENFIVIPSLGSLVPGWVLIIPKVFSLSLSQLSEEKLIELEKIANSFEIKMKSKFNSNTVRFEHGPSSSQSKVGCGVDYAHLHIIPIDFDLIDSLKNLLNINYEWREIKSLNSLSCVSTKEDYLYYRNGLDKHFVTIQNNIPSQLFRRVIAHQLNQPEKFDWKFFPHFNLVDETIKNLSEIEIR